MNVFYYDLLEISDFKNIILGKPLVNEKILVSDFFTKTNKRYKIIQYDKDFLSNELISSYGLLRSVILNSDNKVVAFSPPKSFSLEKFMDNSNSNSNIIVEELVEGTMINLFWDSSIGVNGSWEISTRNTVGADIITIGGRTFHKLFLETCLVNNIDICFLNKEYCYSFVLQHPYNKTVFPFQKPKLYLVELYKINHLENHVYIYPIPLNIVKSNLLLFNFNLYSTIYFPKVFYSTTSDEKLELELDIDNDSLNEIINKHASYNTPYSCMGIVIKNTTNCQRCKIINPNYLFIRETSSDNSKLLFRYLSLRQNNKIKEYLIEFPKHKKVFGKFREHLHEFTLNLFKNYTHHFVKKQIKLEEISPQFYSHLDNVHRLYTSELVKKKLFVTSTTVIKYVNSLKPSQQMFAILYPFREQRLDYCNKKI